VSKPVQATKWDPIPTRQYGDPDLAVDPTNPLDIVATTPDLQTKFCGLMRSTDGGVTWHPLPTGPAEASYPWCLQTGNTNVTEALIAFGRNHTLYYLFSGWGLQDDSNSGNGSIFLARTTDFGVTWQTTLVRNNRGRTPSEYDRPISGLAVDSTSASQDIITAAWRDNPSGSDPNSSPPTIPMVSVSTDGGLTFPSATVLSNEVFSQVSYRNEANRSVTTTTTPGATTSTTLPASQDPANQLDNYGGSNPTAAVDNKGRIYVAWVAQTANIDPSPYYAHFLSTSTDHGKTWTVTQMTPFSAENINCCNALHLKWSPVGGPDGSLNFVYEGSTQPSVANYTQVFYIRSTDDGKTWSKPRQLSDYPASLFYYNGDPNISVAPDGRIDVVFWDTRNDPGVFANDVYYTSSSDGGVTWSKNIRVTDQLINRTIGVYANNYDATSPAGVTSTNSYAIVGWDDSRNGDAVSNTQDIYTAIVQYRQIRTGASNTYKYVLAIAAGPLIVGVVLVVLAVRRRRSYT
jgi:hypothetical protein